jgi:LCP family protein required for cell wall assembly
MSIQKATPMRSQLSRRMFLGGAAGAALAGSLFSSRAVFAQSTPGTTATTYTFLALGLDAPSADQAANSDVVMVARADLENSTLRVLSIPKGLIVEVPGTGESTINEAYQIGISADPATGWESGAASTIATIEENFGVTIDGTLVTNLTDFAGVVDAIGGIVVDNPVAVSDPSLGDFAAGPLTLTGEQAVNYARIVGEDGTGARIDRQQALLQGILDTLTTPEVIEQLPTLITTLTGAVQTDIPANVQAELVAAAVSFEPESVVFGDLGDQLEVVSTDEAGAQTFQGDPAVISRYVQAFLDGSAG